MKNANKVRDRIEEFAEQWKKMEGKTSDDRTEFLNEVYATFMSIDIDDEVEGKASKSKVELGMEKFQSGIDRLNAGTDKRLKSGLDKIIEDAKENINSPNWFDKLMDAIFKLFGLEPRKDLDVGKKELDSGTKREELGVHTKRVLQEEQQGKGEGMKRS